MHQQEQATGDYCVFEYMYRDAGNWKTHGALLMQGKVGDVGGVLRGCFEPGGLFVAEQVRVPSLCMAHFAACGEGPSDLDHAYHEFVRLRPATADDVADMPLAGGLPEMLVRIREAAGRWDVRLSPNCDF